MNSMDLHDALHLSKQDNQPPSYMPRWLATIGLLPTSDIFATDKKGRRKKVTFYTLLHLIYWTACFLFIAMNVCSSVYIIIRAIAVPATDNPLLAALLEGSLAFELHRGAIFCLFVLTNCKSGIESIIRQTEGLIVIFSLTATNVRTIRRFTATFVALTVLGITVLSSLQSARWILRTFVKIEPFFVAPSVVMAPLFALSV
ncbi:hypothetical protein BV898_15413 [Hypsibius exemplaris]|uniref:Uncharacterized protein n=1 Tax=Hypsibius exemplaris TaxID=2072580 RepID=A0A9X6NAV5_HYPEX|nr:hypothetical protein BV898_15413 [Hypsibius exemplaris]